MVVESARREIERIPVLLVGLLGAAGLVPPFPDDVRAIAQGGARREPTLEEAAALTWVVEWDGPKFVGAQMRPVAAIAGFRDVYDYHSSSDVREIIHITGKSTLPLLRWLIDDARAIGRRCVGTVDIANERMNRALLAVGYEPTRTTWETRL